MESGGLDISCYDALAFETPTVNLYLELSVVIYLELCKYISSSDKLPYLRIDIYSICGYISTASAAGAAGGGDPAEG